jgi:hypothetical protein
MDNYYIYIHQRNDTGKCFYIGKGKGMRYKQKSGRNKYWNSIVNKVGFTPQILINGLTEDKSFKLEKELIKQVGIDNLANMTEGGEGTSGIGNNKGHKHSEEVRKIISECRKKQIFSPETIKKMAEGKYKKVEIDGIKYNSLKEACLTLSINITTLCRRLKSTKHLNYKYI